mgnify:CR=1 FL=1
MLFRSGDVNGTNVTALFESYLGQTVLIDVMQRLAARFKNNTTVFDTSMDRNRNQAYGGPGSVPDPRA